MPKNLKTNSSNGTNNKNEYKPHITAKPRILKIFPINFDKDETLTCKQTLLLNVPFRNVNEICSDNNWIRAYEINEHTTANALGGYFLDLNNPLNVLKKRTVECKKMKWKLAVGNEIVFINIANDIYLLLNKLN